LIGFGTSSIDTRSAQDQIDLRPIWLLVGLVFKLVGHFSRMLNPAHTCRDFVVNET
jgi:hypothetical protein